MIFQDRSVQERYLTIPPNLLEVASTVCFDRRGGAARLPHVTSFPGPATWDIPGPPRSRKFGAQRSQTPSPTISAPPPQTKGSLGERRQCVIWHSADTVYVSPPLPFRTIGSGRTVQQSVWRVTGDCATDFFFLFFPSFLYLRPRSCFSRAL